MSAPETRVPGELDGATEEALRALATAGDAPPMSAALEAELAAIAPVPTRRPRMQAAQVGLASLAYAVLLIIVVHLRRDLAHLPVGWLLWYGTAWASGFTLLLLLALMPRRGQVIPRWRMAGTVGLVAAALLIAAGLGLAENAPGISMMPEVSVGMFFRYALPCWLLGIVTASLPVVAGLYALRGAVPVGAAWIGFGLGASGGALGGLVLHMHCPIAHGLHVGGAHGGVIVIAGVVTALVAPRALWRTPV